VAITPPRRVRRTVSLAPSAHQSPARDNLHATVRRILRRMRASLERPGSLAAGRENGDRQALIHRKAVQSDVGKRNRQKSSTMSV
jgi:hypothetical protein